MKLSADSTVPFPLDLVFRTYRDELQRLVAFLPEIRRVETLERTEMGNVVRLVNVWHGGGDIPAPARVFVKESMLTWTDTAVWRSEDWTCDWHFVTHAFTDAVRCSGSHRFVPVEGGTRLETRGELDIDVSAIRGVPRLFHKTASRAAEEFLVKKITPSLTEVSAALSKYLASKA